MLNENNQNQCEAKIISTLKDGCMIEDLTILFILGQGTRYRRVHCQTVYEQMSLRGFQQSGLLI
jgi:hypothetical protein